MIVFFVAQVWNDDICRFFFHFFNILIFWVVRGWGMKGQKMAQNDKKILCNSLSQELYFIWLWLLVHTCKMMTSPAIFFSFFKILIFQVFQSSSINSKRKFWGLPHLLHTCVIFHLWSCIWKETENNTLFFR